MLNSSAWVFFRELGKVGYLQRGGYTGEVFHCVYGFNRFSRTVMLNKVEVLTPLQPWTQLYHIFNKFGIFMLKQAHDAYNEKDYTKAFELYSQLSDDAEAQTSLAFMYQNAQGCEKDTLKAFELYSKAAEQKQPYALFNLAILYMNGLDGIEHDQFKAHALHLEAATLEVVPAMYEVALMLERGLGCMQNYSEAAFWYEEGAKRGHAESYNNLGVLYKEGHGVSQDEGRCFICFSKAAEVGLAEGLYNLGQLYDQGVGCELDHDIALDYCRKAAYKGHEKAKQIIQGLQEDGKIVF